MSQLTTGRVRKWVTLGMTFVLVASLLVWLSRRESIPRRIRIATGIKQGLYHTVGSTIREALETRTRSRVDVEETEGSTENLDRLLAGEVDLAIVQGGVEKIQEVSVVTPLFREIVFVIVRNGTDIENVWQLKGRKVWLGPERSGSRITAIKLLNHFDVSENDLLPSSDNDFNSIKHDESIEAAIVTAGIEHALLQQILHTNEFSIVPIRSAVALELVNPFFRNVEIPRGLFAEHPALPSEPIPTIATTAYLVCRNDSPDDLVHAALGTIHEESLRLKVPTLITREEAPKWIATRMHPTAQRYFNPEDNIGEMVIVMESIVATKELLFAFGAGIYLLWIRWRRLKEKELAELVHRQKERLDKFLMKTLLIERQHAQTNDVERLQSYLDSVTNIKLQALQELTEEDLRGNQEFQIFLDQCSNLIGAIRLKILSQQVATNET